MDPARSDSPRSDVPAREERDARIEELLLSGLDRYFANDYDQAINLWTRVLFLDRTHDRARAYIERARSAQAERQRENEALVHQGLDAFQAGDLERARQLLEEALERGAPRDLALGVLDRIARLGTTASAPGPIARQRFWTAREVYSSQPAAVVESPARRPRGWLGATLLALAAIGAVAVGVWGITLPDLSTWPVLSNVPQRDVRAVVAPAPEALPVPTSGERFLTRAHRFFDAGRLRDALRELDRVPLGDVSRPEADRLRARIQHELLATVDLSIATPAASPPDPPRE